MSKSMRQTTYYKLTDEHGRTFGDCQWGPGVTHEVSGKGALCTAGWIHVYTHPILAELFNPIHAKYGFGRQLWECACDGATATDCGVKVGVASCTTVRQIPRPRLNRSHKIRFAIGCAWQITRDENWKCWAQLWITGRDRTREAAAWAAWAVAGAAWAVEAARAARAVEAEVNLDLHILAEWCITDSVSVPRATRSEKQ